MGRLAAYIIIVAAVALLAWVLFFGG